MVYRRKLRKRMTKRRSRRRVGMTRASRPKFGRTGFFKVIRWSNASTPGCHLEVSGSDTIPQTNGTTQFSLSNLSGVTELQGLFDNYRIVKVLYRWLVTTDPNRDQISQSVRGVFTRLNWCHDFNDSTPISRAQMYQHAGMREFFFSESKQMTKWYSLKPSVLAQMYESVSSTAYTPKWRQWLDTSDSTAPHYGLKYIVDNNYSGQGVRLEAKIIIECKGIS